MSRRNVTAVSAVAPGMANDEALYALLGSRNLGVLATLKRDGRPQLSNVTHFYDAENRRILVSLTDGRAKTKNLRRDPRASYHVTSEDGWSYVVAEGDAELSAVAADPHDDTVEELIDLYREVRASTRTGTTTGARWSRTGAWSSDSR